MKKWMSVFMLSLIFSCSGNNLPRGVLPKDKMEKVIWDMIEVDQYWREYVLRDSLKIDTRQARFDLYERVFQIHKISKATFDKSFEYYAAHPKLLKDVFDSLSVSGTRRQRDFYKSPMPTPTVDSSTLKRFSDSSILKRFGRPKHDSSKAK